jgi:Fe-S-cluster containining protein
MTADSSSPSARLCAACGMCCDGVLFHSVALQLGDSARELSSIGLKLRRKKGVEFFLQPCSAHREKEGLCSCLIYDQRPMRCRQFNCKQILAVTGGTSTETAALENIRTARARVNRVLSLMAQVGETNPNRSLAHRVANALTLPPGTERTLLHNQLDTAMKELESLLEREFRVS